METSAKVHQFLSKTGNFYFIAITLVVGTLLFFTTQVSITHASGMREQNARLQEIEWLSRERNSLDEVYLSNQKEIERLQQQNAEIKRQQLNLQNSAKQKRIEFVHDYGCEVMTWWCEYLQIEVPQRIEFRTNSEWKAKALPNVEPTLEAFAREYWLDPQDFIDAGKEYNIKPEVLLCIAWADTDLWRAAKSKNNIGNVGNNDRWNTVEYATIRDWIFAMGRALNNGYLWNKQTIQDLSRYWNCENDCNYVYASSPENRENNVMNCLNFLYWNI